MIDVSPDAHLPSWRDNDDGTKARVVYAATRGGVPTRLFCSPENYAIMTSREGKLPDDCLTWAVVRFPLDDPPTWTMRPGPASPFVFSALREGQGGRSPKGMEPNSDSAPASPSASPVSAAPTPLEFCKRFPDCQHTPGPSGYCGCCARPAVPTKKEEPSHG